MKRVQNSQIKMYKLVANFFEERPELSKNNAVLKTHIEAFMACIEEIDHYHQEQATDHTGYTVNKQDAKKRLSSLVFSLSASLCSFGVDQNNYVIIEAFKIPQSHVNKKSDSRMVTYASQLLISLRELSAELVAYHVQPKAIDELEAQIINYEDVLHRPRELRKYKKIATEKLKALITKAYRILKDSIDRDMVYYKDRPDQLYQTYIKYRQVNDAAFRALSVMGKIFESDGVTPLEYVKISLKYDIGNQPNIVTKISSEKGNFRFKGIPDGKCSLTFERAYYQSQSIETEVHHQKAKSFSLIMQQAMPVV